MTNKHTKNWEEEKEFEEDVLQVDRVTRVTAGGRQLRFRATVVIGNKKGQVGIGIGKSNEVVGAVTKAVNQAKRNLITIPLISGTIPHEVKHKYKSAVVHIMPAKQGTGVKAGGALRRIAEMAGIRNLLSKRYGCTNKVTNAKATILAFEEISRTTISDSIRERLERETDPKGLIKAAQEKEALLAEQKKAELKKLEDKKKEDRSKGKGDHFHKGASQKGGKPEGRKAPVEKPATPTEKKE